MVEIQRALATIGRIYYLQAVSFESTTIFDLYESNSTSEIINHSKKEILLLALNNYLESLTTSEKLTHMVSKKELIEMKTRLFINIGLIYVEQTNFDEAEVFFRKSLELARVGNLFDEEYKSLSNIGNVLCLTFQLDKSLNYFKTSFEIAKKLNETSLKYESLYQIALVHVMNCQFNKAKVYLQQCYAMFQQLSYDEKQELIILIKKTYVALINQDYINTHCSLINQTIMSGYEKIADVLSKYNSSHNALIYYKKQLEMATLNNVADKEMSVIYNSIGLTLFDLKKFNEAFEYFMKIIGINKLSLDEISHVWLYIAKCQCYMKAPFHAVMASIKKSVEISVNASNQTKITCLQELALFFLRNNQNLEYNEAIDTIHQLENLTDDDVATSMENNDSESDSDFDVTLLFGCFHL